MRTLIIGDIHGNLQALNDALEKASFNIEQDRIICIGDYIDGWENSFEVVRRLLEIKNNSKFENIFLLGNHDKWFLDILHADFERLSNEKYISRKYKNWYIQGGKSTLDSYLRYSDEFIAIHKSDFFSDLKYYHLEDNKLFIHAGFNVNIGFADTLSFDKRELLWNRSLYKEALQMYLQNLELRSRGEKEINAKIGTFDRIYIGHTPTFNDGFVQPKIMGNVLNIDQGCKKNGVLSIWVDEADEFFQNV